MVEEQGDDEVGVVEGQGDDEVSVVEEQGDDEVAVVVGLGDDEVAVVVGLGKGSKDKEETLVWGGFLGSEWPSGVFDCMTRIRSAGWYGSWFLGPVL